MFASLNSLQLNQTHRVRSMTKQETVSYKQLNDMRKKN